MFNLQHAAARALLFLLVQKGNPKSTLKNYVLKNLLVADAYQFHITLPHSKIAKHYFKSIKIYFEFVLLRLCNTNGTSLGQIKCSFNFHVLTGTKVLAKLLSRSGESD